MVPLNTGSTVHAMCEDDINGYNIMGLSNRYLYIVNCKPRL